MITNPLRALDCKTPECSLIMSSAPVIMDYLDVPCRNHFDSVLRGLDLLGVSYRKEPRMVRGLDYYSRTAFEIIDSDLGHSKAVGGGGRYDSLVAELGGPEVSGIGFAIGMERLLLGLDGSQDLFGRKTDVYVAALGEACRETCYRLVYDLRKAGFSVQTRNSMSSLKSHMKQADRVGAQKTLMIGSDELSNDTVTVRDMFSKQQFNVKMNEIINFLRGDGV